MGFIYVFRIEGTNWIKVGCTKWCSRSRMQNYQLYHNFNADENSLYEVELPTGFDPEEVEIELHEELENVHGFTWVPLKSSVEIFAPPEHLMPVSMKVKLEDRVTEIPLEPGSMLQQIRGFAVVRNLLSEVLSRNLGSNVVFVEHTGPAKFPPKIVRTVAEQAHSESVEVAAYRLANPKIWQTEQRRSFRESTQSAGESIFGIIVVGLLILGGLKSCLY